MSVPTEYRNRIFIPAVTILLAAIFYEAWITLSVQRANRTARLIAEKLRWLDAAVELAVLVSLLTVSA